MKATIKLNAPIYQDHRFPHWNQKFFPGSILNTLFECTPVDEDNCKCIAFGFGMLGTKSPKAYGSGAIYVKKEYLIPFVTEAQKMEKASGPVPRFWLVWSAKPNFHDFPTRLHATSAEAYTEAERLAKKHPGEDFFVMAAAGGVRTSTTIEAIAVAP